MIVVHPKALTHVVLELTEPLRRGGRTYPAGYQLAALGPIDRLEVAVCDGDGVPLVAPAARLRVVSTPRIAAPPAAPRPSLAAMIARGLLKSANRLN